MQDKSHSFSRWWMVFIIGGAGWCFECGLSVIALNNRKNWAASGNKIINAVKIMIFDLCVGT